MNPSPRKITVIYDGSCSMCSGNLRWLQRLDWLGRMEAMPAQADEVYERFPNLSRSECKKAMHVVLEDGHIESGADAFREVFVRMPSTWLIGIIMAIPPIRWMLRTLYRQWAPYRHRLGSRCPVGPKARGTRRSLVVVLAVPLAGLVVLLVLGNEWQPWQRLAGATLGMLSLIKLAVFIKEPRPGISALERLIFFTCWPGVDPSAFYERTDPAFRSSTSGRGGVGTARLMIQGGLVMLGGLAMMFFAAHDTSLSDEWIGWVGIASVLVTVHLGFSDLLTGMMRLRGWPVQRLFDNPLLSRSLGDFWGRHWNLAFVEMSRILFMLPLRHTFGAKGAILGIFVISGLLHEMAVSYPVQAGWGMPTAYFILQGVMVLFESRHLKRWPVAALRVWAGFWILAPLPLLFHKAFRDGLIVPFFRYLHHGLFP